LVAGFVALAAILTVVIVVLANQETANQKSIKSMKALTAEAYNFKKTASDFDSITDAFDEVDKKVIKTAADMKSLSETTDKAKELLNNLNTSDTRDTSLLKSIFGTDNKDTISNDINSASQGQIEK
jgi:septal ring factor EnvC (AmiA/AmiB activator)